MIKSNEYNLLNWKLLKVLVMGSQQVNLSIIKKPKFPGKTTLPHRTIKHFLVNCVNNSIKPVAFCVFTKPLNIIVGEQEADSKTRNSPQKVFCESNAIILEKYLRSNSFLVKLQAYRL